MEKISYECRVYESIDDKEPILDNVSKIDGENNSVHKELNLLISTLIVTMRPTDIVLHWIVLLMTYLIQLSLIKSNKCRLIELKLFGTYAISS